MFFYHVKLSFSTTLLKCIITVTHFNQCVCKVKQRKGEQDKSDQDLGEWMMDCVF